MGPAVYREGADIAAGLPGCAAVSGGTAAGGRNRQLRRGWSGVTWWRVAGVPAHPRRCRAPQPHAVQQGVDAPRVTRADRRLQLWRGLGLDQRQLGPVLRAVPAGYRGPGVAL